SVPPSTDPSRGRRTPAGTQNRLGRHIGSAVDAGAGAAYRALGPLAPDVLLRRLGVATPRRRSEFYSLSRILRSMPAVPGAILECGTHHGATLLGMTHVLRCRGSSAR